LLADIVPASVYGRAYGFERAMDNLGAIIGPLLAIGLVGTVGVRWAIGLSIIPGLLAALAIVYAIRHTTTPDRRDRQPIRLRVRPVLQGQLGRLMTGITVFEVGNCAATLITVPPAATATVTTPPECSSSALPCSWPPTRGSPPVRLGSSPWHPPSCSPGSASAAWRPQNTPPSPPTPPPTFGARPSGSWPSPSPPATSPPPPSPASSGRPSRPPPPSSFLAATMTAATGTLAIVAKHDTVAEAESA
jgi:Major Facilitator Superfamily